MIKRSATASWRGARSDGAGTLTTPSSVLTGIPYSFKNRFQTADGTVGTNPEELLAAAHAGCYPMSLSYALEQAGLKPGHVDADAIVTLNDMEGGFEVSPVTREMVKYSRRWTANALTDDVERERFLLTLLDLCRDNSGRLPRCPCPRHARLSLLRCFSTHEPTLRNPLGLRMPPGPPR